jgi:N-acetylneuraminic acid mutarotase
MHATPHQQSVRTAKKGTQGMNQISRSQAIALVVVVAMPLAVFAQASGTWAFTGPVAKAASDASSTLMQNGKVLVAGGNIGGIGAVFPWAQVYDPGTNSWKATPNMKAARNWSTGTLLPDGRVLIVGGSNGKLNGDKLGILKTAEFYDPASGTFTLSGGKMATTRANHTATLLPNGKVLIAGGMNVYVPRIRWGSCTNLAELYDPATDSFSPAGAMTVVHCGHTATLLQNGRVLVVGGTDAELYDPASNSWSSAGTMNAAHGGSAVLLPNGKVLLAGATTPPELYDPATGTFSVTGSPANLYSGTRSAVLLANGKVLIAGGPAGQCELYDSFTGTWSATGSLNSTRFGFGMSLLPNGSVLVTDGNLGYQVMSAEIYTP